MQNSRISNKHGIAYSYSFDETVINLYMEEYKALRQEVNEAVKARKQVIAFGIAGLSFLAKVIFDTITTKDTLFSTFVISVFTALLCSVVHLYYHAESKRVRRASWHLYQIEIKINSILLHQALSWEHNLRRNYPLFKLHHVAISFLFYISGVLSVFISFLYNPLWPIAQSIQHNGHALTSQIIIPYFSAAISFFVAYQVSIYIKFKKSDSNGY